MGYKQEQRGLLCRTVSSLAIASALIALAPPAYSAESTWKGGTGDWNIAGNWTSGIPGAATSAVIENNALSSSVVNLDAKSAAFALTIDTGDTLNILNGFLLDLGGSATINGAVNLQSSGNPTQLRALSDITLAGSGTITLGNHASNQIFSDGGFRLITLGSEDSSFKLQGSGEVGASLAKFKNFATIEANQPTPLIIRPASQFADAFVNQGTMRAVNGATLQITASLFASLTGSVYTNTGGLIEAQAGSIVELGDLTRVVGGTVRSIGDGEIRTTGRAIVENATLGAGVLNVQNGTRLDVNGTLTNNGTIRINSSGGNTDLQVLGNSTLAGKGEILLTNSEASRIYGNVDQMAGVSRLTIGPAQIVRGTGNLGANQAKITNEGTIIADQATALTIDAADLTDAFFNRGRIEVQDGSTLTVIAGASFIQDEDNASTKVLGTMNVPIFQLQAGTLGGTGTIAGTVENTGGTFSPGASTGKTTISGNYSQGQNASLLIELNGTGQGTTYDLLHVTGNAALDGTLDLRFGFTPAVGASFIVLTTGSGNVSGRFDNIIVPPGLDISDTYIGSALTLTVNAVPESETYMLMLTGLGLISWAVKRRQRRVRTVAMQSS